MWLIGTSAWGFARRPAFSVSDMGRAVAVSDPADGELLLTALQLFFGAFSSDQLAAALVRLGFAEDREQLEVRSEGAPEEVSWPHPDAPRALLASSDERTLRIRCDMVMDPVQYRHFRELAVRDPQLLAALAEGAEVSVTVGFLFDSSLTVASVSTLSLTIGGQEVPTVGSEAPAWLPRFLADLSFRFQVPHPGGEPGAVARRWLEAMSSPEPGRWSAHLALGRALGAEPFSMGALRPVSWNGGLASHVVDHRGQPLPWSGWRRARRLELAAAVHLGSSEILGVTDVPDAGVARWLAAQAEEPGGALEQVILCGSDTLAPVELVDLDVTGDEAPDIPTLHGR